MSATPRLETRVRRVAGAPVIAARIWLRGGARQEAIPGQSLLTGRLLAEGTRRRSWDRISLEAEELGMSIHSFGTQESVGVGVDALAADWQRALDWLAELALEPSFPSDRFDWLRRQTAAELDSLLDQPEVRTGRAFLQQLYDPHPYARPLQGSRESLERLTAEDCAVFHRRVLGWGGLVTVAGEIDEDAVRARLAALFGDLGSGAEPLPPAATPRGSSARREIAASEADQAHLYAGHLTLPRNHPAVPAMDVVAVVLGAGAGICGRLPDRIREREGLAYSCDVGTVAGAGLDPGRLVAYVGTSPATVAQAERAIREELDRLLDDGIEDQELEDARSYLLGRDPFRRETARQWADLLAEAAFYGIPVDRREWVVETLEGLSKQDVEDAARRYLHPERLRVTVGLPRRNSDS